MSGARPDGGVNTDGGCQASFGIACDGDWRGNNPATNMPFCTPACGAGSCCSPQSGEFTCVSRSDAGACPAADIFVDEQPIRQNAYVEYRLFEANDCAIVEGCIDGAGLRRLLRFDTRTPNTGGADLFLGEPPPDNQSTEIFEFSACHGHHHFNTYAEYELLDADGGVAARGHKQAFCLMDTSRYPGRDNRGSVYDCGFQGIQKGWQDVYRSSLDCQWVDVSAVGPGTYTLHISLNRERILPEANYDNNDSYVQVTVPEPALDTDVTAPCTNGEEGPYRNCGWRRDDIHLCTPGTEVTVGCSASCGYGSCTGDTVLRVCEADHDPSCTTRWIIGLNDDSDCGNGLCTGGRDCCSSATFNCPASGQYVVYESSYDPSRTSTCTVGVMGGMMSTSSSSGGGTSSSAAPASSSLSPVGSSSAASGSSG